MRIVHIITRLIVGGAQENTLLSCEGQHDLGHDVTLITGPAIGPEGSLMERAQGYGYRVEVVDPMRRSILPGKDYRTYRDLVRILREIDPDIVHTHSSKAGILGRWAARTARERSRRQSAIIHTIHGLAFTASTSPLVNDVYKVLERHAAPLSDRIVCVADSMRDQSLDARIGVPQQYVTVYSGMKTGPFLESPVPREQVRRQLGLRDDQIAVGTIARLFHLKGHEDLIAIAPQLCRDFPNLRFLWIGDGLLRRQFDRQIAQMGLTDRFILTGLVPPERIPELTHAMDILVHPSRREGLARALPQGSLAAKPVVTYDIDGAREAVLDGQSGFVHPPFDREAMARSISLLAGDASLRERLGSAGRSFAFARFDTRVMVDALERVYREALREREENLLPLGRKSARQRADLLL